MDAGDLRGMATNPLGTVMGGGKPAEKSAIDKNQQALAETLGISAEDLAGLDLTSGSGQDPFESALAEAALEVTGIDLFTYGGDQKLPYWVPKSLKQYAAQPDSPLTGKYDPYYGMLDQQGDDKVYLGQETVKIKPDHRSDSTETSADNPNIPQAVSQGFPKEKSKKKKRDDVVSYQQAVNMPYTWEDDEVAAAMKKFRQAGINVTDFDQLTQAWQSLVDRASKTYTMSQGDKKVSPWDVLEMHKREQKAAGSLTDFENGSQTRTSKSVAEVSEGASWQVLQSTLSQLLGRDPSDQEIRDYAYRMNTLAAKNPSITETITRYKAGEQVSSESKTSGGFDAGDMAHAAYDQAQDDPEYAKIQGGTTYYNALIQAMGAVGDV